MFFISLIFLSDVFSIIIYPLVALAIFSAILTVSDKLTEIFGSEKHHVIRNDLETHPLSPVRQEPKATHRTSWRYILKKAIKTIIAFLLAIIVVWIAIFQRRSDTKNDEQALQYRKKIDSVNKSLIDTLQNLKSLQQTTISAQKEANEALARANLTLVEVRRRDISSKSFPLLLNTSSFSYEGSPDIITPDKYQRLIIYLQHFGRFPLYRVNIEYYVAARYEDRVPTRSPISLDVGDTAVVITGEYKDLISQPDEFSWRFKVRWGNNYNYIVYIKFRGPL